MLIGLKVPDEYFAKVLSLLGDYGTVKYEPPEILLLEVSPGREESFSKSDLEKQLNSLGCCDHEFIS